MRKLYASLTALFLVAALNAQVTVTYQVDITDYLQSYTLGPNGMRIGGNFGDLSADGPNGPVASWAPSDASAEMMDMGNNIWSIAVTYSSDQIGNTQLFKFVNNDWGVPGEANEGGDMSNISTNGCGVDDGAGNINRELVIPDSDITLTFCWEDCFQCDGSDPLSVGDLEIVRDLNVGPNPVESFVRFNFNLDRAADVRLSIMNILGAEVTVLNNSTMNAGQHTLEYTDMESLPGGTYFYQFQVDGSMTAGKLIKR